MVTLCGFVSQAGLLDLVRAAEARVGGGAVEDFMGGSAGENPSGYADASPIALLPLRVPSVCVHGHADTVVPHRSVRALRRCSAQGRRRQRAARLRGRSLRSDCGRLAGLVTVVAALTDLIGK